MAILFTFLIVIPLALISAITSIKSSAKALLFILIILSPTHTFCQQNSLATKIGKKEGFTEATVYAILKDKKGFMWYGTADGLWKYDGYQHTVYKHNPKNKNSLSSSFITCLIEDSKGIFWVGTLAGGLNRFDPVTNTFNHFKHSEEDSTSLRDNYISELRKDAKDNIWVCSGKLSLLNQQTNSFTHFDQKQLKNWSATSLYCENENTLWVGSNDGFAKFDLKEKVFTNYSVSHPDPVINERANVIRCIKQDKQGDIWLGTYGGLVKLEVKTGKINHWVHDDLDSKSLAHNSVWDLEPTHDGKVWVATWGGGISLFNIKSRKFENETFQQGGLYEVGSLELPSLHLNDDGTVWYGSNARGIFKIKLLPGLTLLNNAEALFKKDIRDVSATKSYTYFIFDTNGLFAYTAENGVAFNLPPSKDKKSNSLSGNRVSSISENTTGTLFIGTDFGLTVYDPRSKSIKYFLNNSNDTTSLSHNSVITSFLDSKERLWIGTPFGLNLLLPQSKNFARWRKMLSANNVISIGETGEGLWVGTSTGGLNLLNQEKKLVEYFKHDEQNNDAISNNYINYIFTDSNKSLWVGTRQGLNKFNSNTKQFTHYQLSGEVITTISESKNGLYVRTEDGIFLSKNDSEKIAFKPVPFEIGTIKNKWCAEQNRLYFFADKQIGFVHADSIKEKNTTARVVITGFQLDPNNKHPLDSLQARLNPSYRKEIVLSYNQNLFSIEFAALNFSNSTSNQYAYQLEGFDQGWTYSDSRRFVTYTNMSPGRYIFKAKASNREGLWTDEGTALVITILPPPWKTWWAYTGYIFTFLSLLYLGRKTIINRERLKAQVRIEKTEKQTLKELDNLKTKFFSNITHEFRTPLTLIQGPANELLEKTNDTEAKKLLTMIKNNSTRLLTLINQLLDLARLDSHEVKLNVKAARLDILLKTTISQFTSLATSRLIHFEWHLPTEPITVFIDEEKIETILINLLSNAMKFTPTKGIVLVSANYTNQLLEVEVKDSGRGIPADKLEHVFDRFYQVEATDSSHSEGTGIGLALIKEYVELMKGTIQIESQIGSGTAIKIALNLVDAPEAITHVLDTPIEQGSQLEEDFTAADDTLPLLLIVEDNEDIRTFIKTCLGNQYRYSEARHGREGLTKAQHEIPDIIISDLMMPEMDGLELCQKIKKDIRTNHIPFILLTAKAEEGSKMEGLQTGADDYIIKPFNKAELIVKVRNHITLREKLQAHIKNNLLVNGSRVVAISANEKFISAVKGFIEAHLKDESLTVQTLAAELNLSREQCYRKINALTGLSPSGFIRKLRLQKAAQLLSANWGPISQIAYEVGFDNVSYFSKAFKDEFGKTPSDYGETIS